jgi:uncharacterized membrane protein
LLFVLLYDRKQTLIIPILGSSFWLFSRWPLALFRSGQIDAVPIIFMLLTLLLWERRERLALLSLGLSLAIKHMAVFIAPLFLFWSWQNRKPPQNKMGFVGSALCLLCFPILFSVPFLFWDYESYLKMLIFPLTRNPSGARSADLALRLPALLAKLPFFLMLGGTYLLALKRTGSKGALTLLAILSFLAFNSVFFSRYFCWAIPLVPLACFESRFDRRRAKAA